MSKRRYAAGETIIRKGDLGNEFFLVSEGEVEVIRADHEVARLGPGDFFGEVALISGEPRNATVVAQNAVDTYLLDKTDFEAALATSQSFRDQLYRIYFMRHLGACPSNRKNRREAQLSGMSMSMLLRRMKVGATVHGMRSTMPLRLPQGECLCAPASFISSIRRQIR